MKRFSPKISLINAGIMKRTYKSRTPVVLEIIPNWHPIFVHFTVALFTTSVSLYIPAHIAPHLNFVAIKTISELETVARWCLWIAAFITIFTIAAGLFAYYTIAHDETPHAIMTIHRNWGLGTTSLAFLTAIWSAWRYSKNKSISLICALTLLATQCLLLITAWYGGELVYRYGAGVIPVTKNMEQGHHHANPSEAHSHQTHSH